MVVVEDLRSRPHVRHPPIPRRGAGVLLPATGIWPLVSIRTFEAVTGPKADDWLVNTVGVLVAVVGAVLRLAAYRGRVAAEVMALAVGSAMGLMGIDLWYVARRVIPRICSM